MRSHPSRRRARPSLEALEGRRLLAVGDNLFVEYSLPTAASAPTDVAVGPDGGIWITESAGNKIARFDPDKSTFAEYAIPTSNSVPSRIKPGGPGDMSLYFTENVGGKLGRITTVGVISEAAVTDATGKPIVGSPLVDLAFDPLGGAFYVTQTNAQQLGLFEVGDFFEYVPFQQGQARPSAGGAGSTNWGVAFDRGLQSTAVYFTERDADKIGVFESKTGGFVTTEYALAAGSKPLFIVQGPDGGFWFTASGTSKIGRIDPVTRFITEYATPTPNSQPWGIVASKDKLYFTESAGNKIGRITFDGGIPTITEYALPDGGTPRGIAVDAKNQVWFAEEDGNKLGVFLFDSPDRPYVFNGSVNLPTPGYTPFGLASAGNDTFYTYVYNSQTKTDGVARFSTSNLQDVTLTVASRMIGLGPYQGGWLSYGYDGNLWTSDGINGTFVLNPATLQILRTYPGSSGDSTGSAQTVIGPDRASMYGVLTLYDPQNPSIGPDTSVGIARFDASGAKEVDVIGGDFDISSNGIGIGSGNVLWYGGGDVNQSSASSIIQLAPDFSSATPYLLPTSGPQNNITLTLGADGNVYFTDLANAQLGRITPDGVITLLGPARNPNTGAAVSTVVSGPDGLIYFLLLDEEESSNTQLAQFNPTTGAFQYFAIPASVQIPFLYPINLLAVGPDGNLWVSTGNPAAPSILRFTLSRTPSLPAPPPTVGSYLAGVYGRLIGVPPSDDRLEGLARQALGSRSNVTRETELGSIPDSRREAILSRLAGAILRAPEYRRARVERVSASLLYRPADRRLLGSPGPVRLEVLGSRAYLASRAGGRPDAFVSALYRDLLRRAPEETELRRWTSALSRGAGRREVAAALAHSREGLATEVRSEYRRQLGRSATPGELAAGMRTLRRAGSTNPLVRALIASDESIAGR